MEQQTSLHGGSDTVVVPADVTAVILDPSAYADGRIYDAYAWLRGNNPVGLVEHPDYDPFWLVTRHADVQTVSRNNDLFHSGDRSFVLVDKLSLERIVAMTGGSPTCSSRWRRWMRRRTPNTAR